LGKRIRREWALFHQLRSQNKKGSTRSEAPFSWKGKQPIKGFIPLLIPLHNSKENFPKKDFCPRLNLSEREKSFLKLRVLLKRGGPWELMEVLLIFPPPTFLKEKKTLATLDLSGWISEEESSSLAVGLLDFL